jgi:hypothetical protein
MKPLFPTFYLLKLLSITIFAVDYLYRVGMGGFIRENIYIKNIRKIGMKVVLIEKTLKIKIS